MLYTATLAVAFFLYHWSCQGEKILGCAMQQRVTIVLENSDLARHVLENGLAGLQVSLDDIQVELIASQQRHIMQLYCSKHMNDAFRFFWKAMGLVYANPPFSLLAKHVTKIAYEGGARLLAPTAGPNDCGKSATPRQSYLCA